MSLLLLYLPFEYYLRGRTGLSVSASGAKISMIAGTLLSLGLVSFLYAIKKRRQSRFGQYDCLARHDRYYPMRLRFHERENLSFTGRRLGS